MATVQKTLKMRDLMKEVTIVVQLKGHTELKIRLAIGKLLIRLSAWVIGCRFIIAED